MRVALLAALIGFAALAGAAGGSVDDAQAHRDGCHRWHSCPSDTGSYTCGDTGYTSECGGLDVDEGSSSDDEELYGSDDLYGAYDYESALPRVDVNAEARERAQAKVTSARARLDHALMVLPAAKATARRFARPARRARRQAERREAAARTARAAADGAETAMVAARARALERVTGARAAHHKATSGWSEDRKTSEALCVIFLLFAAVLALWTPLLRRIAELRDADWDSARFAKAATSICIAASVVAAVPFAAVGLPAASAVTLLIMGFAVLSWLAWRSGPPYARFPLRRRATTSGLAVVLGLLAVGSLGSALSTAAPVPPTFDEATMRLADLARPSPKAQPTQEVADLQSEAERLESRAGRANVQATIAERRAGTARRAASSLEARIDAARRSASHWTKKVEALAPEYEYSYDEGTSGGGCDPNYEGACLDPASSDYDCESGSGDGPDYTGYVEVVGDDPYDLDRDGDGIACE